MAVSVVKPMGILNVLDFGAVGDTSEGNSPGTPCAAALQAAIRALDPLRGGEIYLPYAPSGGYFFEAAVLVDRPVYIHGAGRSYADPATRIYAAPGVTPLIFASAQETGKNDGATGFIIEKLNISSLGKNTNRQNASFDFATPDRVTVAAVGDFTVNQVVRVGGVGERQYYYRTKVNTRAGSNTIDGALSDVYGTGIPGLQAGMWIMVPGAHQHPVKVSAPVPNSNPILDIPPPSGPGSYSVVNGDGTPAIASATLAGAGVQYCDDFYGRITHIVGDVLQLDTHAASTLPLSEPSSRPPVDRDHPNTEVSHASCGIYSRVFGTIRDVFAGHINPAFDMEGCGVLLFGDHGSTPPSNLNGWRCEHLFTYGCQHGLKILGTDANAGTNAQSLHLGARSWTIIDYSFLGNVHINPQMSGGTGIITRDNPGSRTVIIGPYNEEGTSSNFGVGTDWHGGTIALDPGGVGAGSGTWNKLYVGRIDAPTVFQCQTMMQPAGATDSTGGIAGFPNFLNFQMAGGSAGGLSLRKLESAEIGVTGGFAFIHEGGSRIHPIVVVDVVGGWSTGSSLGDLVLGQGFWLGENMASKFPSLPRSSHWTGDVVDPVSLGLTGAQRFHVYSQPVPGGYVGWAGTASSDPSAWTTFGEIISNDILIFDVAQVGGPDYTLTDIQAAHRVIRATGTPAGATRMVVKTPAVFSPGATAPQPNTIWRIIHNHSGQELTVKATTTDPGIVVTANQSSILWSDGTSFFKPS